MMNHKTINDFIKELQNISEEKRKLPLIIFCPNGEETYPKIRMRWEDPTDWLKKGPDKMVIHWE